MGAKDFIAGQLRRPTGFFGRHIAARYMTCVNVEINRRTLEALSVQPDDRVLEVGPGPGDLMNRIVPMVPSGSVIGVDFSPEMIDVCSRRFAPLIESGRIELRCASADAMPFAGDQFTKACTVHTIYFWRDPAAVFREFWRVLRTGGRLVVSFFPVVAMEELRAAEAFARYDGEDVARLMEQAGFRDPDWFKPGKEYDSVSGRFGSLSVLSGYCRADFVRRVVRFARFPVSPASPGLRQNRPRFGPRSVAMRASR